MTKEDAAAAIKEAMEQYNRHKARWIESHGTDRGFDAWFGQQINRITTDHYKTPDCDTCHGTRHIKMWAGTEGEMTKTPCPDCAAPGEQTKRRIL